MYSKLLSAETFHKYILRTFIILGLKISAKTLCLNAIRDLAVQPGNSTLSYLLVYSISIRLYKT